MKKILNVFLVLIIIVLFIGCSNTNINGKSHLSFENERTNKSVHKIQIDKNVENIEFNIESKIDKGNFEIIITKPSKDIYWSEKIGKNEELNENIKIKRPMKGDWEIIFKLQKAIGEYRCSWKAK